MPANRQEWIDAFLVVALFGVFFALLGVMYMLAN